MDTSGYLATDEYNLPRELRWGVVHDAPAPSFEHQDAAFTLARLMHAHVDEHALGFVGIAPLDVVLDAERCLIVQPDVLFVSAARSGIIRQQVWGAPDLVAEVCSAGSRTHDQGEKLEWYRRYGVREYWLVDPYTSSVVVFDFTQGTANRRCSQADDPVVSSVLPGLCLTASQIIRR